MNPNRIAGICMLAGIVPAVAINKMIDRKLARAEKPGRLNTWYRGRLKWGRTWGVAINLVWGLSKLMPDLEPAAPKAISMPDKDYSCVSAYCDDPACNLHGLKNSDEELMYWKDIADDAALEDNMRAAATKCTCTEYQITEFGPWIDKCWFCQKQGMARDAAHQQEMDEQSQAEERMALMDEIELVSHWLIESEEARALSFEDRLQVWTCIDQKLAPRQRPTPRKLVP